MACYIFFEKEMLQRKIYLNFEMFPKQKHMSHESKVGSCQNAQMDYLQWPLKLHSAIIQKEIELSFLLCSRCIFSVLLILANAIKMLV